MPFWSCAKHFCQHTPTIIAPSIPSHSSLIRVRFESSPHHVLLPLPSTPRTTPQAHPQTMQLETTMQIVFGILSALIAVFGIWLAWRFRGKSLCFMQGLYPATPRLKDLTVHLSMANTPPARNSPAQHTSESLLPIHRYHASPEGRYLPNTILHHTFGSSTRNRCPYLSSTAQQTGWMLDTFGRR